MYEILVTNATMVTVHGCFKKDLAISGGKIVALLDPAQTYNAKQLVNANGQFLFPGIVDLHFHSRVPGNTQREDFDTATMAAARGGVTTIIEMPICEHSPCDLPSLQNRISYCTEKAVIDFGFYGAGATKNAQAVRALTKAGVVGWKMFLHKAPAGREEEFRCLCAVDGKEMTESLAANRESGLLTCVHCEDDGMIRGLTALRQNKTGDWHDQIYTRVPESEQAAILQIGLIAKAVDAPIHICHATSKHAVSAIQYLKNEGVSITAETCPPYLFMDQEAMKQYGAFAKVNPPLKTKQHRTALIQGLKDGTICAVCSDHAPFLPEEKNVPDFLSAPAGMPSVEMLGPAMLDSCRDGTFDYAELAHLMAEMPAKLLGIYPKKGTLEVGSDADFFLYDPEQSWKVKIEALFTKSRMSATPFQGKEYRGRITQTYVRGVLVYDQGSIKVPKGHGRYIPGKGYIPEGSGTIERETRERFV